nr:MAG TPA: hypothetical protein [Caudoviricetes sp.]
MFIRDISYICIVGRVREVMFPLSAPARAEQ